MKKIQGAPAGRVKGSSQGSSLEPLRIRERRDSHGQKPPTRGDPGSRIFFIFLIFSFFCLFEKKVKKNQENFSGFLIFLVCRKKSKKIQGAPAGRVKGSSQGSSLEPLRIRERRDSHGQKPPTRGDPGSRIFFIFLMFLIFFVFWLFRKKSKKLLIFLVFRKKSKNEKNQKNPGCPRRESQGLQPGLQPGATQDPGEEGFPRPETPHAGRRRKSKNPGCPRRESQGLQPGLQPGATQDGFPRPETSHEGRPRVPDFFSFF